jgi:hypothetical protein
MRLLIVGAVLALSSCAPSWEGERDACSSMGYWPGTEAFLGCMDRMESNHAVNQAGYAAMLGAGVSLMQPPSRTDVYVH